MQLREDFDNGADISFSEDVAIHDVATLLKEFFRDLPEPLIPKELIAGLLAIHSKQGVRCGSTPQHLVVLQTVL